MELTESTFLEFHFDMFFCSKMYFEMHIPYPSTTEQEERRIRSLQSTHMMDGDTGSCS